MHVSWLQPKMVCVAFIVSKTILIFDNRLYIFIISIGELQRQSAENAATKSSFCDFWFIAIDWFVYKPPG